MMGAKLAQVQAPFVILLLPITYLAHQQIVSLFRAPSRHLNMVESTALQADHRGSHGGQFMGAYANTVLSDDPICQRILKNLRGTEAEVHDRLLDDGKFVPADRRPDLATMIDDDIEMGQQHTELLRQQAELRSREATNMTQDSGDEKHSTSSDDHFVVESAETTAELF
jgi:hypothetical protein